MSFIEKEELHLGKNYEFTVIISHDNHKHVGTLSLSSRKITLKITGESDETKDFDIGFKNITVMECSAFRNNFLLFNLTVMSFSNGVIDHQQKRYFHECIFDVKHVIQSEGLLNKRSTFNAVYLHSSDIQKWIGHTAKQYELMDAFSIGNSTSNIFDIDSDEFSTNIDNLGELCLRYNRVIFGSPDKFVTGMQFPPSINLYLDQDASFESSYTLQKDIHDILSFLFGKMIKIDKILLSASQRKSYSLYYPVDIQPFFTGNDYALFPLSRNLKHDTLGLPELTLEIFNNFFNSKKKSFVGKYLKYRSMQNSEERFLGYFRMLESLCYQEAYYVDEILLKTTLKRLKPIAIRIFEKKDPVISLLNRTIRLNSSKYNTERCISLFIEKLPKSLTDIFRFKKSDLGKICKARNDITHANDVMLDEHELFGFEKFIETLFILAMLDNLNVSLDDSSKIIYRNYAFHHIKKDIEPQYTTLRNSGD
jgi:hypothetical protein